VDEAKPFKPYVMAAEHREPCDLRGSCTVLGARGGEIPPRDSTNREILWPNWHFRFAPDSGHRLVLFAITLFCLKVVGDCLFARHASQQLIAVDFMPRLVFD
jgi:hypothetical protein